MSGELVRLVKKKMLFSSIKLAIQKYYTVLKNVTVKFPSLLHTHYSLNDNIIQCFYIIL